MTTLGGQGIGQVSHIEQDCEHHCHDGDGLVLAAHEGLRSFADGGGDVLHFGSALIGGEDGTREQQGGCQGKDSGCESNPEIDVVVA
jgi:hypothetical protein